MIDIQVMTFAQEERVGPVQTPTHSLTLAVAVESRMFVVYSFELIWSSGCREGRSEKRDEVVPDRISDASGEFQGYFVWHPSPLDLRRTPLTLRSSMLRREDWLRSSLRYPLI
jgi:hypothetical protein